MVSTKYARIGQDAPLANPLGLSFLKLKVEMNIFKYCIFTMYFGGQINMCYPCVVHVIPMCWLCESEKEVSAMFSIVDTASLLRDLF